MGETPGAEKCSVRYEDLSLTICNHFSKDEDIDMNTLDYIHKICSSQMLIFYVESKMELQLTFN